METKDVDKNPAMTNSLLNQGADAVDLAAVYAPIARDLKRLDRFLAAEFVADDPFLNDLLAHVARFRGKQIRPALLFLASRLIGEEPDADVVKIAAVIELIHTATLVHDDLLDSAELRRNVETLHRRWGDRPAILMGDLIYSRAFHLSTEVEGMASLLSETTRAICEGELLQIGSRNRADLPEDVYFEIIQKKTAILHGVACQAAGLLAACPPETCEVLRRIGLGLGMAFQIVDDCLDYAGEEHLAGKSLGSDLRQGKLTLPLILLRDELGAPERDRLCRVLAGPIAPSEEARIQSLVRTHGVLPRSFARAEEFIHRAQVDLSGLSIPSHPPSLAARESLLLAASYILRRQR